MWTRRGRGPNVFVMPLDAETLLRFEIPEVRQHLAARDAVLYALSVGLGQDPLDTRQLDFVDHHRGLRGDGGFGGPAGPVRPSHPMPATAPDHVVDLPTRPEQALLYRLNGDGNPLHADPAVAEAAGFPRPILHGLCTLGVVGHALLRTLGHYDPARFQALDLRFSAPVFPGETIRTEIWDDGAFQARVVERDVLVVSNGRAAFKSEARPA